MPTGELLFYYSTFRTTVNPMHFRFLLHRLCCMILNMTAAVGASVIAAYRWPTRWITEHVVQSSEMSDATRGLTVTSDDPIYILMLWGAPVAPVI